MVPHDRAHRQNPRHRLTPTVDDLEDRRLPSLFGTTSSNNYGRISYQASIVRHDYDEYVSDLKRLELASRATPAEYLALRDDARAISAVATAGTLPASEVQFKAVAASLVIDRAPLDGSFGDAAWSEISGRLSSALDGLNVPPTLVDQTIVDMRALAVSAGVGPDGFATFNDDFNRLRSGEQSLPANSGYHFEDPSLYYTQHLRGFFRDWGAQKVHARATLDRDLAAIRRQARTTPAGASVIGRDTQILESLGAAVPSATKNDFNATYAAAFAQGTPTPDALSQLRTSLITIVGPAGTSSRIASVDRLIADAPAFYQAAGASEANIRTIVGDVGVLVDAGGGEPLNPFKVTVSPGNPVG